MKDVQVIARSWVKPFKSDKICDVLSQTSGSKQSFNIPFLGKYFFESFEALVAETKRHYTKIFEKKFLPL